MNLVAMQNRPLKIVVCLLCVCLAYLQYRLWLGDGSVASLRRFQQDIELQRVENVQLRQRNQSLRAEVFALKEGTDAIEERARADLGMIKKGETFFMVVTPGSEKTSEQ